MAVIGSVSEAGKILQKFKALGQTKGTKLSKEQKKMLEELTSARQFFVRTEGIRRGILVSKTATAARNLQGAVIRAPLEGLGRVLDEVLYQYSNGGTFPATKAIFSPQNYKDSFKHFTYMWSRPDQAAGFAKLILESDKSFSAQYSQMYDMLSEIQTGLGKGSGGIGDVILSELEDITTIFNIPNRWQEHLVRNAAFLGNMEREVRRQYGIDLIKTLQKGQLNDLISNNSAIRENKIYKFNDEIITKEEFEVLGDNAKKSVTITNRINPEEVKAFNQIVDESVQFALDLTYAKQPEIEVFRHATNFITRNGLTVIVPFPRFMFNSMELLGQYALGASIPLTRKVMGMINSKYEGKFTDKDRQRVTRNIIGLTIGSGAAAGLSVEILNSLAEDLGILSEDNDNFSSNVSDALISMSAWGAAYQYRTSEGAPTDSSKIRVGNNVVDVTSLYPLPQLLYMAEAGNQANKGTFDTWFDEKKFIKLFTGTNFRKGSGNTLLNEVSAIANLGVKSDIALGARSGEILGRLFGNYANTWMTKFAEIIDLQRGLGQSEFFTDLGIGRTSEIKDYRKEPVTDFSSGFSRGFLDPIYRSGLLSSPREEAKLPQREMLFSDNYRRSLPMYRAVFGITAYEPPSEEGEYIAKFNFTEYDFPIKLMSPAAERYEKESLRKKLPIIVNSAKNLEEKYAKKWEDNIGNVQEEFKKEEYVAAYIRPFIYTQIMTVKRQIRKGTLAKSSTYSKELTKYNTIPKNMRKLIHIEFFNKYKRHPLDHDISLFEKLETEKEQLKLKEELDTDDLLKLNAIFKAFSKTKIFN